MNERSKREARIVEMDAVLARIEGRKRAESNVKVARRRWVKKAATAIASAADTIVLKAWDSAPGMKIDRREEAKALKKRRAKSGEDIRAEHAVDTIASMRRRGQLSARQEQAALIYRDAFDQMTALRGTLDPDRVSGGGAQPGKSPAIIFAAEKLNQAAKALGKIMGAVVAKVIGEGLTLEDCAGQLYGRGKGGRVARRDQNHIGRYLRDGLDVLADLWLPGARNRGTRYLRSFASFEVRDLGGESIAPTGGASADRRGVVPLGAQSEKAWSGHGRMRKAS